MKINIRNNELLRNSASRRKSLREKRTTMEQRPAVLMRNGACYDSRVKKGHAGTNNRFKKSSQPQMNADIQCVAGIRQPTAFSASTAWFICG